jgi:hypothetical protein
MEIAQSCLALSDGFRWFGNHWGDLNELKKVGITWFSVVVWGPFSMSISASRLLADKRPSFSVALIVQTFYAWRIRVLSKRVFFPAIILLVCLIYFPAYPDSRRALQLALFQCAAGFWAGIGLFKFGLTSGIGWHRILLLSTSVGDHRRRPDLSCVRHVTN